MNDRIYINEEELNGALNALFLESHSHKADEGFARFVMQQEYNVAIDANKERELLARLGGKQGGGKTIFLFFLSLLLIVFAAVFLFKGNKPEISTVETTGRIVPASPQVGTANSATSTEQVVKNAATTTPNSEEKKELKNSTNTPSEPQEQQASPSANPEVTVNTPEVKNNPTEETTLPYFNT